jgi:hypothetical protein
MVYCRGLLHLSNGTQDKGEASEVELVRGIGRIFDNHLGQSVDNERNVIDSGTIIRFYSRPWQRHISGV